MSKFHKKVIAFLEEIGVHDPYFEAKVLYSLEGYKPDHEPTPFCANKIINLLHLRYAIKLANEDKLESLNWSAI